MFSPLDDKFFTWAFRCGVILINHCCRYKIIGIAVDEEHRRRCGGGAARHRLDLHGDALGSPAGPTINDLRQPRRPMGSVMLDGEPDLRGVVRVIDAPLRVAAAIRHAQVDLDPTLGYDPQLRPGVSNLAVILGLLTDKPPIAALFGLHGANQLKRVLTEALQQRLRPVRGLYTELVGDPVTLSRLVRPAT